MARSTSLPTFASCSISVSDVHRPAARSEWPAGSAVIPPLPARVSGSLTIRGGGISIVSPSTRTGPPVGERFRSSPRSGDACKRRPAAHGRDCAARKCGHSPASSDPASVARFYTDDASILGGGGRYVSREQLDRYWTQVPPGAEWTLEAFEVGGDSQSPWVRGRSTLRSQSGRSMETEYIGILKRQPDGKLRFYVDMYVSASSVR